MRFRRWFSSAKSCISDINKAFTLWTSAREALPCRANHQALHAAHFTIELPAELARTTKPLRSVSRIAHVATTMLIAEMPELGQVTGEQAADLTGLAHITYDSGALLG